MYQCISVSVYQCISVSVYQCIRVSVCNVLYACISASVYTCIRVLVCNVLYACISVCVYQYMRVSVYIVYQCIPIAFHISRPVFCTLYDSVPSVFFDTHVELSKTFVRVVVYK